MSCGSHTCNATYSNVPARDIKATAPRSWLAKIGARIGLALERMQRRQFAIEIEKARQRGILKELDDRLLRDIGLTREQAMREARKRFWN